MLQNLAALNTVRGRPLTIRGRDVRERLDDAVAAGSRAVRELAAKKHAHVKEQLALLHTVEAELALLLKLCRGDSDTCPILTTLDGNN